MNTSLDESREKKELKKKIRDMDHRVMVLMEKIDVTKKESEDFTNLYEQKVGGLTRVIEDLDRVLEKYHTISGNIDDHFSFNEASEAFDQAMADRQAELEEEYRKFRTNQRTFERKVLLKEEDEIALKKIYRKLARIVHPDILGGDAINMMRINHAYAQGDLELLEEIELSHVPIVKDDYTLTGLQSNLDRLKHSLSLLKGELRMYKKSEMYTILKKLMKKNIPVDESLDTIAAKLQKDIDQKKKLIKYMQDKFEAAQS